MDADSARILSVFIEKDRLDGSAWTTQLMRLQLCISIFNLRVQQPPVRGRLRALIPSMVCCLLHTVLLGRAVLFRIGVCQVVVRIATTPRKGGTKVKSFAVDFVRRLVSASGRRKQDDRHRHNY